MPNILIVDEEPLQRMLVREILSDDPTFTFFEAVGGAQALRLIQNHHPHTIILGLRAPDLDKIPVYERLRASPGGGSIPLILTTTGPRTDPTFKILLAMGHPVLVKPFEPEDLQAAVRRMLNCFGVPSPVS